VTARFLCGIKFSLGGKFKKLLMNQKNSNGIGPAGRWFIFGGIPLNVYGVSLTFTVPHGVNGLAHAVGEKALPYVIIFMPLVIIFGGWLLYRHFPNRLVVPFGVAGWIMGLSLMYWYYWFGPGAFGHH
jgi:hypothetical protein